MKHTGSGNRRRQPAGRTAGARQALLAGALVAAAWGSGVAGAAQEARPAPPASVVRVTLLGTGNPRPDPDRFGPSSLVEAGPRRLLVDAGRGATIRLFQLGGAATLSSLDLVLLTHLHSDHVVGLPDLWLTPWIFNRVRPLRVLGPSGTAEMAGHLERAFAFDTRMRQADEGFPPAGVALEARDIEPGVAVDEAGVRVTAFAVDHGPVKPAYGYRIDYAGRSVVFSGDTRASETLVAHARGVDLLVHEVISPEVERRRTQVADPGAVARILARHVDPEAAGRIFARTRPRLAVYSHIVPSPATAADLVPPTRRTYDGPLAVGHDLMTITIGDRVEVSAPPH